jgi:hypothetical protein
MLELATKNKMRGGRRGHAAKLISGARELVETYEGQQKSAIEQAKVGLEEKLETLRILDTAIQDMICASESTDEAFVEEIESSAKVRAEMQEAIILINGALSTGGQTLAAEPSGNSSNAVAENGGSSSHARLPKLEVRKFKRKDPRMARVLG